MPLTKRQSEILTYLQGHIHGQGYAPSFEEIAEDEQVRQVYLGTGHA